MKLRIAFPLCLSFLLLLGGCATGRSILDIQPPASKAAPSLVGKEVMVTSVSDKRIFEVKPKFPSIPSLDPGEDQSAAIKARAVGRKRNGYGMALGDIILKEGQTVETLTATSIRQAFAEKGYTLIAHKEQATPNTVFVEATVDQFWSWANPGFAGGITLDTEITTKLSLKSAGKDTTTSLSVKASSDFIPIGTDEEWIKVINKALRAYMDGLKAKLD
jgi:hypothetical protein